MKIKNSFIIGLLFSILVSCSNDPKGQTNYRQSMNVVEIPARDITSYQRYTTSIEGLNINAVRSKTQGYISKVYVREGQYVTKDQALFRLETNTLSQDASAAKAALNSAQARVRAAQVEVTRLGPLVVQNIVSQVRLDTAEALLSQAQADQTQAEAQHNSVLANIDYAIIKSPINGVVGNLPFKLGSLVGPQDPNPLTVVSDVSKIYANFSMSEKEYFNFLGVNALGESRVQRIQNFPLIDLLLADGSTYAEKGILETIAGIVDSNTGTIQFRAIFPNTNGLLNNGNSGTVLIPKVYKDAIIVPASASFEHQGLVYVYKVDNDTTRSTIIQVTEQVNNLLVVGEGLKKGDQIVAEGVGFIRNQMPVSPNVIPFDSLINSLKPLFK